MYIQLFHIETELNMHLRGRDTHMCCHNTCSSVNLKIRVN